MSKYLPFVIENVIYGQEGRVIMINAKVSDCKLCIVNIYAPTEKKYRECFFKQLLIWIQTNKLVHYELVVGGDLNSVLSPSKDVKGGKPVYYKTPKKLKSLIKKLMLCDIWRKCYPEKHQFTWRNVSLNVASRLDYWLVDKNLKSNVIANDIRPAIRCDHNAIFLRLVVGHVKKRTRVLETKHTSP